MKKELTALMEVSTNVKHLCINGAFRIIATPVNQHGDPVNIYKDAIPVRMALTLEYTLTHDKAYGKARHLRSSSVDDLKIEIAGEMASIMTEITSSMINAWENGYIQGKITEE